MRIDPRLALSALLALTSCASLMGVGDRGGLTADQVAKLPPNERVSYTLFTQKCSRCHTLARPLTADITEPGHWRHYVNRMRRQPGSGISPADGEQILVFLEHWAEQKAEQESAGTSTATEGAP